MIVVSHISKRFRVGETWKTAIKDLSFEVSPGEVFGLLGPNGAGKTTTLRTVMGLLKPDTGYAEVAGMRTDYHSRAVLSKLGMISTNDGVYPWLTVREMLLYFADLYGVDLAVAKDRMQQLASLLSIEEQLGQRCSTLSTGQKQRVILARGLIHDPPVMLLDEPTRGLDVVGSRTIFQFIKLLRSQGKAVLISTHRLDEAERLCDRFGLIHDGSLKYQGTLKQIQDQTGKQHLVDVFIDLLGESGSAEMNGVLRSGVNDQSLSNYSAIQSSNFSNPVGREAEGDGL